MSVRVDESAEAPKLDNQNAATPEEPTHSVPTSFSEKTKNWHERHKPRIRVALGVTLAVGLGLVVAAHRHARQGGERYDPEDIGDSEPVSDREITDERRQSALAPDRDPFLRRLPTGQQASEAAKDRHRQLTGNNVPPGYTSVRPWFFPSTDKKHPGGAAA